MNIKKHIGICALLNIKTELKHSHIFPKFSIEYSKKTGSKYLRNPTNPNRRIQDGVKYYLLSQKAEQKFSVAEKWFAEKIFKPYLSHELQTFIYNTNLYYFAASLLWRILTMEMKANPNINTEWYYSSLLELDIQWKSFLSTRVLPAGLSNIYFMIADNFQLNNSKLNDDHFYFSRCFDGTIVKSDDQTRLLVYAKFNKFVFWTVVLGNGDENKIAQFQINPVGGISNFNGKLDYHPLNSFFDNRINTLFNLHSPSEMQQKIIEKEVVLNPIHFINSEAGQSFKRNFSKRKE